jgi:hypothetical protein
MNLGPQVLSECGWGVNERCLEARYEGKGIKKMKLVFVYLKVKFEDLSQAIFLFFLFSKKTS